MRITRETYFMGIAKLVSQRSTCERRKVGSILTLNNNIISTGFNGAPSGMRHKCIIIDKHCISCVHSEINSIIQSALHNSSPEGGTIYCTAKPCSNCLKMLINAKIKKVIWLEDYSDGYDQDKFSSRMLNETEIEIEKFKGKLNDNQN